MDLYFCKKLGMAQIYRGRYDIDDMYEHIINQDLLCCCNERLYFYYYVEGRYIQVEKQNEWHVISNMISSKMRNSIAPKHAAELVSRIKNTASIQVHIDKINNYSNLINLRNVVLDYKKRELLEKSSDYMFTYQLNVNCFTQEIFFHR